jgi:hypothetical protein
MSAKTEAVLNLLYSIYGPVVEESWNKVMTYGEKLGSSTVRPAVLSMDLMTVSPIGKDPLMDAVFVVSASTGLVFVDELGLFGPKRKLSEYIDLLHAGKTEEEIMDALGFRDLIAAKQKELQARYDEQQAGTPPPPNAEMLAQCAEDAEWQGNVLIKSKVTN